MCLTECRREASVLFAELDGGLRVQRVRDSVGFRGRVWVRWMGKYDQLREASGHVWAVC